MSRKEKTLPEKWKSFFSRRDTTPIDFEGMRVDPYVVDMGTLKDIGVENSVSHRLKSLKDLYDHVLTKKLADYAVESICKQIEDLLSPHQSAETRHIVFQFYIALITGQLHYMQIMRTYLFRLIVQHNIAEDIMPRLEMLKALSENGKTITNFEEEIGPLLLTWFPGFMNFGKVTEFLALVTNVIKFNAAYLDDNVVEGYIRYILTLVCKTKFREDLQESLNMLEAILCYSHLPRTVLQAFVRILCSTVNVESLVPCSLKQMRNLLGTNIGHTGIFTLCVILQDVNNYKNPKLVRGAVFFIGMALWSEHKVSTLSHPPTAILPSFLKVIESNEIIIVYEVVLALNRLVTECGDQLHNRSNLWDAIFEILEKVFIFGESQPNSQMSCVIKSLNDLLSVAEKDCPEDSHEFLFRVIDMCSDYRSEQSVKQLIVYKSKQLKWYKPNFSANLNLLLEKFFKNEKRPAVQLETLNVVRNAREINASFFEDDIIDQAILQNMSNTDAIPDSSVRKGVVELLISMLESSKTRWFLDILEVIEKIMKRMFENPLEKGHAVISDSTNDSNSDVVAAVEGLVHAFKGKLFCMPSSQCIEIFSLLVKHINLHYVKLSYTEEVVQTRKLILEFFFQIRANRHRQIGAHSNTGTDYSVYILCDSGNKDGIESPPTSPPPSSPSSLMPTISYLSYNKAYQAIITCLKEELDWTVLEMVFKHIPVMLQNKTLIVKGNCSVPTLCSTLCSLINDRSNRFPDSLKNTPPRLTRTDVQGHIFPCVAALTSYHSNLESHMQRMLIKCLQFGLVSRSAKICMEGLTLCILEMQNSMIKLLPDVLLNLSKISATKIVAVSVLEFLSNLIRLPHLYVSFVEDQYMSIFAIALPYTNPFKFNQYTVALAHHVLSMWFLKCRIPFRRDFAKFITKGLRSNLNVPLENQSSSSRSDEDASLEEMTTAAILALHTEFMETGLDLMARFTFGMCTNVPQRSPVAEFLLENGQKSSWLVGNKIVTITTSGCGTKSFKQGLCERCYTSSHELNKNLDSGSMGDNESIVDDNESIFMEPEATVEARSSEKFSIQRKRHRSAIQGTNTTLSQELLMGRNQTKDDIRLHYQKFRESSAIARRHTYVPDTDRMSTIKSMESSSKSKDSDKSGQLCSCWCTSWAEVHIRRPTGNTSWMMKMNNQVFLPSNPLDVPLSVLNSLILPQIEKEDQISCQSSADNEDLDIIESEFKELSCSKAIDIIPSRRTVPPMRRTNSSPDMNTGWLLSMDREPKQSTFESSTESERNNVSENEELTSGSSTQSSLSKQEVSEKVNPKNLKLDLSASRDKGLELQSSISSAPIEKRLCSNEAQQLPPVPPSFRDRGHTISVMSPSRPIGSENLAKAPEVSQRSGISPSFVFLQLFHNSSFGPATYKPLLLQQTETNTRALTVLDHIPPYDTHKIGIVYVGPGQAEDEVAILSNIYGSARYVEFLRGLGEIVDLSESDPHTTYLGGLDTRGEDGTFALIWHDDVMQVVFHVATFMTNKESDKNRNEKKKHIANDGVMIVYNESGEDFKLSTIKGHVTNACIVIKPEDFNCNIVSVKHKTKELADTFGHTESYIVSDQSLPVFVRQMALHANLASLLITRRQQSSKYAQVSNWLERLRTIKRLRSKVLEEIKKKNENFGFESSCDVADYDDFTDYV